MKFRVGACALLICLAGCSSEGANTKFGDLVGSASPTATGAKQARNVPAARNPADSIANAPDRGALVSYKNKGAASKQEGAYTWFPVAVSEEHALRAVATGQMTIPSPDGSQVKLRYERHVEHPDGNWTWIGRVEGGDQNQEAILTFGERAVYGTVPQAAGAPALSLQTRGGVLWAVVTDPSKVVSPNKGTNDVMVPPALALRASLASVAAKAQVAQKAVAAGAPATAANTIDVAIGYTQGFATAQGGQSAAVTRLNFLIEVGNQSFTNSLINGYLRLVNAVQVNYADDTANQAALSQLTGHNGTSSVAVSPALVPLRTARDQYGADLAVLVRKFQTPENDGCGVAWLNGANQTAINPAIDDDFGFAVISDGNDTGTDGLTYFCAQETLVHELAHLMGSAHDRDNSKIDENLPPGGANLQYGRYAYSFGMKTNSADGNFYTIMAYGDDNQNFYRTFSNPLVVRCGSASNLACGVANQTDNARSLNQTIPVVATFRSTIMPFVGAGRSDINGDGKDDLVWHNAALSSYGYWLLDGAGITHAPNVPSAPGFTIAAQGDFNGDGRMDLVWTSPQRDLYFVAAGVSGFTAGVYFGTYPSGWKIVASGDVDNDGKSDLIWHNATSREYGYWLMNGATNLRTYSAAAAAGYTLATAGDLNGDGRLDLMWAGPSGDLVLLTGNGATFTDAKVGNYPDAGRIFAAGDVNGDGKDDLLIQNKVTNRWGYWIMNGAAVVTSAGFSAAAGYYPVSVGDYNGDGLIDVIWSSPALDLQMLAGNGTAFVHVTLGSYSGTWKPIDKSITVN